ncbi:hypothetical protein [Nocardia brasiliensis]|uniref:hypothetical protein n=1 Tax=Nocardia brasiliensis TaxID=37326 RepID=UPI001E60FE66|nr:hypothetical protein [Nocardia brasiliensis]
MAEQTTDETFPAPSGQERTIDRVPRRRRIAWVLAVAVLLTVDVVAVPVIYLSGRFYRLQEFLAWAVPVCWIATGVLVFLASRMGWRRTRDWLVPTAVLALSVLALLPLMLLWLLFAAFMNPVDSTPKVVAVSSDGRLEAVTYRAEAMIDTICGITLRERVGLFSRQTDVWEAPESQPCPKRVSFTGNDTISIIDYYGREIKVRFDADRMKVA